MYACILAYSHCTYKYTCIPVTCMHSPKITKILFLHMYVCIYVYIFAHTHTHMHCMCVYTYIHTYLHICHLTANVNRKYYLYVCIRVCMNIYVYASYLTCSSMVKVAGDGRRRYATICDLHHRSPLKNVYMRV